MGNFGAVVGGKAAPPTMTEQEKLEALIAGEVAAAAPALLKTAVQKAKKAHPVLKAGEDEVTLLEYTKGEYPTSGKDHIIKVMPKGSYSKDEMLLIPEVDKEYEWEPDVLEAIAMGWSCNLKVLLNGEPGTGKTTAAQQFCAIIGMPFVRISCKDGMEPASFFGTFWVKEGSMTWKDGVVPDSLVHKRCILFDEIFKLPASVMMCLQSLLEQDGSILLEDKPGTIEERTYGSDGCFILLADNALGEGSDMDKYSATQLVDTSTLDRIDITVKVNYMKVAKEEAMLNKKHKDMKEEVHQAVSLANLVRKGYKQSDVALTMSLRGIRSALTMVESAKIPLERALSLAYLNKLGDTKEKATAVNYIRSALK